MYISEPEPTNHVQENVRRMRQIQRETRRRQEETSKPLKALWKSNKFEGVQSKVKERLEVGIVWITEIACNISNEYTSTFTSKELSL